MGGWALELDPFRGIVGTRGMRVCSYGVCLGLGGDVSALRIF